MNAKGNISRRKLLKLASLGAAGATLAACAPQTVTVVVTQNVPVQQTVEVTKEVQQTVQVEVTKEVQKVVEVTSTPTKGLVNALGVELPPDALPLDKQVILRPVGTVGGGFGHLMESMYNRTFEGSLGADALTANDLDLNVVPMSAESWKQSDDGLSWDFTLRKELQFSDGTPMTAKDWDYTLKWSLGHGYDFGFFFLDIKNAADVLSGKLPKEQLGIEAVDDYTLRITTNLPTPYAPSLGTSFFVAKNGIWESAGDNWALDPKRYVSSGAYTLSEFNRGVEDKWVINDKYKGTARPYITLFNDKTLPTGLAAYINGDIQTYGIAGDTPPAERALINANPVLRSESHPQPAGFTNYLGFNTLPGKFPPLDNPDVRMALCKAIDKENLIGEIYQGWAYPAYGILPNGFPGYTGDKLKALDPNVFDVAAAQALLSKAGFPDGKGFPKFELWIRQPAPIELTLCQAIQARWKENLGISVDLKPADFQAFAEVYKGKGEKAPIYYVAYSRDYADPATFLNVFVNKGGRHPTENQAWDDAYQAANYGKKTAEERFAQLAAVETTLVNSTAYYFLDSPFGISLWPCNAQGPALNGNKKGFKAFYTGAFDSKGNYGGMYWGDPACRAGVSG